MADNNRYLPAPSYNSLEDTTSLAPVAEYQQAPEEVGLYPLDRMERLKQAKERKTRLLSKTNNMASLDDSFTDLGNGLVESNANKVWNQLSDQEIQSTFAAGVTNNSLTKGDDGTVRFSDGTVYNGPTKRLYGFGTQDKSNDEVKLGITSGYYDSSERRYNNPKYDVNLGPKGVDIADPQ